MQHLTGAMAIECHDRCARFHIVALHIQRDQVGFSIALEEQQLMNSMYHSSLPFRYFERVFSSSKSKRILRRPTGAVRISDRVGNACLSSLNPHS